MTEGSAARRAWLMWGLGAACYLVALFHRMSLGVAALDAERRFHVSPTGLATLSAAQLFVYLLLQVPSGVGADQVGPRRMLTLGLALMGVGSAVFAFGTGWPAGLAGRALVGVGDACMFVNVLRLARGWFPGPRYALVAALTGLVGGVGQLVATAPLAAGLRHLGWTSTFGVAALVTLVLTAVAFGLIRESGPAEAGAEVSEGHVVRRTWSEVVVSWHAAGTRQAFWAHYALMGSFVAFTALWGEPFLVQSQQRSEGTASLLLGLVVVAFVVGSPLAGRRASSRPDRRLPLLEAGYAVTAACWGVLVLWPGRPIPLPVLVVVLALLGAAGGASMVAFDLVRTANPGHRAGTATGVANMGGFVFAVVAELAIGGVLDVVRHSAGAGAGFRWGFAVALVLVLLGAWRFVHWSRAYGHETVTLGRDLEGTRHRG